MGTQLNFGGSKSYRIGKKWIKNVFQYLVLFLSLGKMEQEMGAIILIMKFGAFKDTIS